MTSYGIKPAIKKKEVKLELIAKSNQHLPISLEGVCEGEIVGTTEKGYLLIYKVTGKEKRTTISKELYTTIRAVFDDLKQLHQDDLRAWANNFLT